MVPQGYLERLTPHRWRRCLSVIAGGEGEVEKVVAESPDVVWRECCDVVAGDGMAVGGERR